MTVDERKKQPGLDEQLAPLVASSNTIKVLTILTEREASPKEIATRLGLPTPVASHHVKKLERLGMVELMEERHVGGVVQHVYRAVVRPLVGNDEWQRLSIEERQRFSAWILQLIVVDAARSLEAALFDAPPNNHLSRIALALDRQGFDEVAEIQDRALAEVFDAQARSVARLADGEEPVANVVSAMMCFEVPAEVSLVKVKEAPSTVPSVSIRKSN